MGRRPSITIDDMPKGWEDIAIEMAEAGGTVPEITAHFNISKKVHYRMIEQYDDYREIIELCKAISLAYFVGEMRDNLNNRNWNNSSFNTLMRSLYNFDKDEKPKDPKGGKDEQSDLVNELKEILKKKPQKGIDAAKH